MGTIYVDEIKHQSAQGSGTITLGASGETINIPSGVTLTNNGTQTGLTLSDNILFNTASKGIYLGVTTATASNLLDDYEEGTWTPIIVSGFTGTPVYSATDTYGRYTKIGNRVFVNGSIKIDSGITASGAGLQYGGLPFTSLNAGQVPGGFYFTYNLSWSTSGTASFYLIMNANNTTLFVTGTNGIGIPGNTAGITLQGSTINIAGQYVV